jgi:hypothetical protein
MMRRLGAAQRIRACPLGLLGMIALVGSLESSVARFSVQFLDLTSATWRMSADAARCDAVDSAVLCFGDSLLKFGLVPEVIEQQTRKRTYNLAVNAGRTPASFFLLRRALEAGATPAAVLIDVEPNILAQDPLRNAELWAELAETRDYLELAWTARDPRFLARTCLARMLPSLRFRFPIRLAVLALVRGEARHDEFASLRRNCDRNRGALVMPHDVRTPVAVMPPNGIFYPTGWRCNRLNGHYLRKFFKLANARGIPVFLVVTPYTPPIQELREQLGQDAEITRFTASLRSSFPESTVLDARRSGYDSALFWDGMVHLDARGAVALSAEVAGVLKRHFATGKRSGWVDLPPYRDPESAYPVEDIEQSATALRAARGPLR